MKVGVNKGSKVGALRKAVADTLGLPPGRVALFQSTRSYVMKCMDDNASLDFLSKHYDICAHEVADEYPFSYTAPIKYTSTYWGGHQQQAAKAPARPESPLAAVTLYFGQKRDNAAGATYFYNNNRRPNATWTLFGDPWLFNVPKNPLTPKELYEAVAAALGIADAFSACQENNTSLFTLFVCNDVYGHTVDQTAVEMSDVPLNGGLKALITIVVQFHESVASEALRGKKLVGVPGVPAAALTDDAAASAAENGGGGGGGGGGGAEVKAEEDGEEEEEEEEDGGGLKLLDCFELFSAPEKLSPEDAWYCGKCKNHVEATKTMELWSVPDVLVLHLKRFSYSRYSRDKLETDVSFPLNGLDVSKFVKGPQGSVSVGGGVGDQAAALSSSVFDCVAVSNHMGSLGGGHYTASARSGVDGKWYKFNDSSTSEMQPSSVNSGDVYLLFYVRRGKFGTSCDPDLEAKGDVL